MQGSPRIDELRQKFHENPRRYFAPLANEYRKAGDPEQAIAICRAHLAQQPGHMSGHVVYGQSLYDAKRPEEARVVFEKALSLDPDNAIVLKNLGDIAREKGDNQEAKHWYSRALDVDPGDSEVAAYIAELTEPVTDEIASEEAVSDAATETAAVETVPETGMPSEPADIEVPLPAVSHEPETEPEPVATPAPDQEATPTIADEEEVAWRKTPPHEDSPFVTRTMAELYAKQGYRSAALDVYRQLALHHPDDREIMDRIEELSKEPVADVTAEPQGQPPVEIVEPAPADSPAAEQPFAFQELDNEIGVAPSSEDLNLVPELSPDAPSRHFTETELDGPGDSWDSDSWAAGFSADEAMDLEFNTPDAGLETPAASAAEDATEAESQPQAEAEAAANAESEPEQEPVVANTEAVAEPEIAAEPEPELVESEAAPFVDEQEPIVAYSPELPENEELPHYSPRGPTIRELFAILGARKPLTSTSYTARAALPEFSQQPLEEPAGEPTDLPLASDAFANMFAESEVTDEDSRAAFALSGAITASETPASRAPTPPRPAPAQETATPAVPATTEESEEDIRRFREWLDGLQDS